MRSQLAKVLQVDRGQEHQFRWVYLGAMRSQLAKVLQVKLAPLLGVKRLGAMRSQLAKVLQVGGLAAPNRRPLWSNAIAAGESVASETSEGLH